MTTAHERVTRPRDLRSAHLVLSQFSLPRGTPFEARVAAAAGAGFEGIGLSVRDAVDMDAGMVADTVARHGLVLSELEAWPGWGQDPDDDRARALADAVFRMADATAARHVQVYGSHDGDRRDAARRFGAVCDRAAEHGLLVALEFLPFTNVVDARTALEIIERADRPNGGLCVDIWHHERGARDLDQLRAVPPERVVGVQIDDGPLVPVLDDYYEDCVRHRSAPGEGEFDLVTFLRLLRDIGADAPLAVEVLSDSAQGREPLAVAHHLHAAMVAVRDRAWGTPSNREQGGLAPLLNTGAGEAGSRRTEESRTVTHRRRGGPDACA